MASVPQTEARQRFSLGYRSWFLALLVGVYACSFIDRIIINTVGPAIIREMKLSDFQFGLLGGMAFAIFYAAFGIPIAWVAERTNRISVIAVCIALWSGMTALCGVSQSYGQLLLFRMGVGVGEAGCGPSAQSLISDHYPPKQRASALAIFSTGVPLGSLLGAAAGGWVAQTFSWRMAFLVVGLPGLVLALLARLTLREPARGHSEPSTVVGGAPSLMVVIRQLISTGAFRNVCAGFVLTNLAANGVNVFAPSFFVRSFHLGLAEVGLVYGLVIGVSGITGMLAGGFGVDFAARKDVRWYAWGPAFASLLAFPCYLVAFTRTDAISAAAALFVGGLLLSLYFAPTFAIVQNLVEPRMRATAAALVLLTINIFGQGLGPTAMGLVSDVMARRLFTLGDYSALCHGGRIPSAALDAACGRASAGGLQASILLMTGFFLWGAAHYFLAARTIRRDMLLTSAD